ncbi:MAG: hypothetical protein ACK5HP_04815 [Bacilli bacterium]
MREVSEILKKYNLKTTNYKKIGKTYLIETNNGKYIIKEKLRNTNSDIIRYLESRNFNYVPKPITDEFDDYEIIPYIDQIETPEEQKVIDMINLVALLHSKTTHYKEVATSDYKKIYEDIKNNIEYLNHYYDDVITIIESKVYMSPSEYLLARNISKIFAGLFYMENELDDWLDIIIEKRKQRHVVIHNNLEIDHFLKNKNEYLISWDKSKIDIPIFDLYKLYKKHGIDYDFENILKSYERIYPLLTEERKLLFILIGIPDKIEFNTSYNEFEKCREITKKIDIIYKTEQLILPYNSENKEKNTKS